MNNRWNDLQLGILSGLLVVACDLVARPFAETGFMDDWSYKCLAQVFLQTGRVVYNGWPTTMVGWQIPYGALFMKIFGPSFFAARLSTLPLAFGCVVLFHLCAERFGVRGFNALFGSLTFGLSPLVLPLVASFMTDIGGVFVLLLCLYFCERALLATRAKRAIAWLVLAAVSNILGGTIRQIVWLGVLVLVPATAWLLRKRRGVLLIGAVLWGTGALCVLLFMHWFKQQPYTIPERILPDLKVGALHHVLKQLLFMVLCLGLIILPVLVAWVPEVRTLRGVRGKLFWTALPVSLFLFTTTLLLHGQQILMPWLQAVLDNEGVWSPMELLGNPPVTLGFKVRAIMSVIVIVAEVAFLAQLRWKPAEPSEIVDLEATGVVNWDAMRWLLSVFLAAYTLLLIPRAVAGQVFDRYFVCALPFVLMLLIRAYQQRICRRLPSMSVATLAVLSAFAVAALHDSFAGLRANMAAVAKLKIAGVPRTEIDAGWISNGLVQLELGSYVNNPLIEIPKSAFHSEPTVKRAPNCQNWFDALSPVIRERYVLTFGPVACLSDTRFAPTTYSTWLPPFDHTLYVEQIPNQ
ncbi:MAG TPA: hypothetical protein VHU44_15410 [Acidobacteriaceae bacterium]|nr:hypothetical protein [Acidobacteriaceae bacterium]